MGTNNRDGEMLASISAEGVRHQHPNHLGTPRVITDESGLIVASQLLRPFGEEASGSGPTGFLKFTGHERDFNGSSAANHLDYMRARYYSPHLGRFLSLDRVLGSVEVPQSWNRYSYARYNPLKLVDPDGEVPLGVAIKVVKIAIKGGDVASTVAGIVEDARTIVDPEASLGDKAIAALSLASEVFLPVSAKDAKGISGAVASGFDGVLDGVRKLAQGSVVSRISESPGLVRQAQRAGRSAQRELDSLVLQLQRGNLNPGLGSKSIAPGFLEKIRYLE